MHRYVTFENLNYLDEALSKNKGVILTSLHTANVFYIIVGIVFHPHKYHLAVVGNMANKLLFQELLFKHQLDNLHIIATTNYEKIKEKMVHHLKKNRILLLMSDFSNRNQPLVPFWPEKLNIFHPTPQGAIALHKETGASLVPCLIKTDNSISKAILEFHDPSKLLTIEENLINEGASKRDIHAALSIALSKIYAPFLIKNVTVWTEFRQFYRGVSDEIRFKSNLTLQTYVSVLIKRVQHYFEKSFDPSIDNAGYIDNKEEIRSELDLSIDYLENPEKQIQIMNNPITLTKKTIKQRINIIENHIINILSEMNEETSLTHIEAAFNLINLE